jgi:hypothetical protein
MAVKNLTNKYVILIPNYLRVQKNKARHILCFHVAQTFLLDKYRRGNTLPGRF